MQQQKKKKKRSWGVPQVMEGGDVQVGGLERLGTYKPSAAWKIQNMKARMSASF